MHLNGFLFGILGGIIHRKNLAVKALDKYYALLLASIVPVVAFFIAVGQSRGYYHNGLLAPLYVLFFLGITLIPSETRVFSFLSNRISRFLGNSVVVIYILHAPIYLAFGKTLKIIGVPKTLSFYLIFLGMLCISPSIARMDNAMSRYAREFLGRIQ